MDPPLFAPGGVGGRGYLPPTRFFSGGGNTPTPWPGGLGACFYDCGWFAFRAVGKFFGQADGAGVVRALGEEGTPPHADQGCLQLSGIFQIRDMPGIFVIIVSNGRSVF